MTKNFQNYIRIVSCIATASIALSALPAQSTSIYNPPQYVDIGISTPTYLGSVVSFPPKSVVNSSQKEMPISGYVKVRIRNVQKKMEWN
jgi:hypothetical protein